MKSTATTVREYLEQLPADRRASIESVRAVILKNLDPLFEEGMQYGMIGYYVPHRVYPPGYHCDPAEPLPFVCLASQKNYMSVYLGCVYGHAERERWFHEAWAKAGKKLDMGKSCVRFRKLDDLALDVLGEAIRQETAKAFIRRYEATSWSPAVKQLGGRNPVRPKRKPPSNGTEPWPRSPRNERR
jgi:hypothetical protein